MVLCTQLAKKKQKQKTIRRTTVKMGIHRHSTFSAALIVWIDSGRIYITA